MAHKKAAGSAKNLRDSKPKYRGLKLSGGQIAKAGNIVLRQQGKKYEVGNNTYISKDYTIHAKIDGIVHFTRKKVKKYNGRVYEKTFVHILQADEIQALKSAQLMISKKSITDIEKNVAEKTSTKKTTTPTKKESKVVKKTVSKVKKEDGESKKATPTKKTPAKKTPTKKAEDKA